MTKEVIAQIILIMNLVFIDKYRMTIEIISHIILIKQSFAFIFLSICYIFIFMVMRQKGITLNHPYKSILRMRFAIGISRHLLLPASIVSTFILQKNEMYAASIWFPLALAVVVVAASHIGLRMIPDPTKKFPCGLSIISCVCDRYSYEQSLH